MGVLHLGQTRPTALAGFSGVSTPFASKRFSGSFGAMSGALTDACEWGMCVGARQFAMAAMESARFAGGL